MKIQSIKIISIVLLGSMLLASCGGREGAIQIAGSDSEVNMVQNLAELYMQKNPDQSIAVTGGGSGTGIAALINNQVDIANSSRAMSETEIAQARSRGIEPVAIPFAIDGIAIITNEALPLTELSIEQISKIYKGDISNWSELGGPDQPITVYGRQSNSGTYVFFREFVVKGDYTNLKRNMNGTAQIVEAVRNDISGIGYVGIGYVADKSGSAAQGLTVLNVSVDEASPAYSPLEMENVTSGRYPISRPLYQFTNGVPTGKMLDFIRFELSEEGQASVVKSGFYPLGEEYKENLRALGIIE